MSVYKIKVDKLYNSINRKHQNKSKTQKHLSFYEENELCPRQSHMLNTLNVEEKREEKQVFLSDVKTKGIYKGKKEKQVKKI